MEKEVAAYEKEVRDLMISIIEDTCVQIFFSLCYYC